MKTNRAQVHRFHDKVAVYVGDGQTVYMQAAIARKLARALNACARSVDQTGFLQSKFETVEIKWESNV
jgi:uncharacterized membrane protein YgaE (UPF0421/DUF939 family)